MKIRHLFSIRTIAILVTAAIVVGVGVCFYLHHSLFFYDRQRILERAHEQALNNNQDGALSLYNRILSRDARDGEARAGRASAFIIKGDMERAARDAEIAIQNGAKAKGFLARGQTKLFRGDHEAGIVDIDIAIAELESKKLSADDKVILAFALGSKGTTLLIQGHADDAQALYFKALEMDDDSIHHYNLAMSFMAQLKDAEAIPHFTDSIERRPSWMAYVYRGYAYMRVERPADALSDAEKALEWGETDFALYLRGVARINLKDFDGAADDIESAIQLRNNDPKLQAELERFWGGPYESNLARALSQRAIVRFEEGRFDEVVADASRATDLFPSLAPTWMIKGHGHWKLGQYESALASMRKTLELDETYKDRVDVAIAAIEADMKKARP